MNIEKLTDNLFHFIDNSPTAFHAVANAAEMLTAAGYQKITRETEADIQPGGKYFLTRNDTSIIAFRLPEGKPAGLRIAASHSDSPCFKVKENPEMAVEGHYRRLNTEGYGGMIMSTWMDRPLSIAGRVMIKTENGLETRLVNLDRDLCVIPNVAIHFNREINKGYAYNPQVDLIPLFSGMTAADGSKAGDSVKASDSSKAGDAPKTSDVTLKTLCAQQLGVAEDQILASDLYLYNRDKGRRMGANNEFIGSPRLDDLQCAFGTLAGFLKAGGVDICEAEEKSFGDSSRYAAVYAVFDNEEVGSSTKQGANSTFLEDVVDLICESLELTGKERRDMLAGSFMLSADNAHAVHPNHPEKSDPTNRPYVNGGIVLKFQGSQKYTTDGYSAAVIRNICAQNNIPCQSFANRSDVAGGSTLGNISSSHVSIPAADIGLPQFAMHSAFETAGMLDTGYLAELCEAYFSGK